MNLLTQLARALGLQPAPEPPFGNAFADDDLHPAPTIPFRRMPFSHTYSEEQQTAVWEKGQPMIGWDPDDWRVDHHGNPVFRDHYGDMTSSFGWEVGHVVDPSLGGGEELANLRPQQCGEIRSQGATISELIDAGRPLRSRQ